MQPKSYAKMIAALFPVAKGQNRPTCPKSRSPKRFQFRPDKLSQIRTKPNKFDFGQWTSDALSASEMPFPSDPDFIPKYLEYRSNVLAWKARKQAEEAERAKARLRFCAVAACAAVAILIIAATIAKTTKANTAKPDSRAVSAPFAKPIHTGRDRSLYSFQAPGLFSSVSGSLSRLTGEGQGGGPISKQLQSHSKAIAQLQKNEATNFKTLKADRDDLGKRLVNIENFLYLREQSAPLPNPRRITPSPVTRGRAGEGVPSSMANNQSTPKVSP